MVLPQPMRLSQGKLLAGGTEHILKEPSEGTGLVGGATGGDTLYHGTYMVYRRLVAAARARHQRTERHPGKLVVAPGLLQPIHG